MKIVLEIDLDETISWVHRNDQCKCKCASPTDIARVLEIATASIGSNLTFNTELCLTETNPIMGPKGVSIGNWRVEKETEQAGSIKDLIKKSFNEILKEKYKLERLLAARKTVLLLREIYPGQRLNQIKLAREVTGSSLKNAKAFVEGQISHPTNNSVK